MNIIGKIKAALPKDHGLRPRSTNDSVMVVAWLTPQNVSTPARGEGSPTVSYLIERIEIIDTAAGGAMLTEASDTRHGRLSLPDV